MIYWIFPTQIKKPNEFERASRKITIQAISIKTFKVCEPSVRVNISIDCAHVHDQSKANTTWLTNVDNSQYGQENQSHMQR